MRENSVEGGHWPHGPKTDEMQNLVGEAVMNRFLAYQTGLRGPVAPPTHLLCIFVSWANQGSEPHGPTP